MFGYETVRNFKEIAAVALTTAALFSIPVTSTSHAAPISEGGDVVTADPGQPIPCLGVGDAYPIDCGPATKQLQPIPCLGVADSYHHDCGPAVSQRYRRGHDNFDFFLYYNEGYNYTDRMTCRQARALLIRRGYYDVEARKCAGRYYVLMAFKRGHEYRVRVDSVTGRMRVVRLS